MSCKNGWGLTVYFFALFLGKVPTPTPRLWAGTSTCLFAIVNNPAVSLFYHKFFQIHVHTCWKMSMDWHLLNYLLQAKNRLKFINKKRALFSADGLPFGQVRAHNCGLWSISSDSNTLYIIPVIFYCPEDQTRLTSLKCTSLGPFRYAPESHFY